MKSRLAISFLLLAALSLGGCVRIDIGGERKPTVGKQMIDLYRAKKVGAISDTEFKHLQEIILGAIN